MTDAVVTSIADRYRELYTQMTGNPLTPVDYERLPERIERSIVNSIN